MRHCKDCGGRCTAIEVELNRLLKRRRVFFKMSTCVSRIAHNPSESFGTELAIIKKINLLTLSQMWPPRDTLRHNVLRTAELLNHVTANYCSPCSRNYKPDAYRTPSLITTNRRRASAPQIKWNHNSNGRLYTLANRTHEMYHCITLIKCCHKANTITLQMQP